MITTKSFFKHKFDDPGAGTTYTLYSFKVLGNYEYLIRRSVTSGNVTTHDYFDGVGDNSAMTTDWDNRAGLSYVAGSTAVNARLLE